MLKFTTLDGRTLRLRHSLVAGAITGASEAGPLPGTAQLITGGAAQFPPVKSTPDEVWEEVKRAEERERVQAIEFAAQMEKVKA